MSGRGPGLGALLVLSACHATAAPLGRAGTMVVVTGFAFPSIGGGAAAYVTLRNDGTAADTVVEFSSPAAGSVMAHETVPEGASARMRMLHEIPMAPKETVAMAPGGIHLMLGAVRDSLIPGRILSLTIRFARAGTATVPIPIRRFGEIP